MIILHIRIDHLTHHIDKGILPDHLPVFPHRFLVSLHMSFRPCHKFILRRGYKLIEEILELELKLAALAEEIDDLENHVCVELRAEYDQKVGNLEYQARAYQIEIARLKRAIELLQAAINRQEAAKYEDVQKRIEAEYKEYEEELHKKAEDMKRDSEYAKRRAKKDQEESE